ncbi:hypothetical protein [Botrimarina mediterranea]|uniref:hypothetical protein n=1 Tax=Botrimarina mediterranea TaxID=2528022 RepID=UPI003AF32C5B
MAFATLLSTGALVFGAIFPREDAQAVSYLVALLYFACSYLANAVVFTAFNLSRSGWRNTRSTVYLWQGWVFSGCVIASSMVTISASAYVLLFADFLPEEGGVKLYGQSTTPADLFSIAMLFAGPLLSVALAIQIWANSSD